MKSKIIKRLGINKFISTESCENAIGLYDTSIATMNVGDEIINKSIYNELADLFTEEQFIKVSTHDGISSIGIHRINLAKIRFLCGSNIMTGKMFSSAQWNISPLDIFRMKSMVTIGVGWVDYQSHISNYSKIAYHNLFSKDYIHSVRDEYTKDKFNSMGINNVLNTSCATMWKLTPEHCEQIPTNKSKSVVFTLTDYRESRDEDQFMVETLIKNYQEVFFWVQGSKDLAYFSSLNIEHNKVKIVPPQLSKFDQLLSSGDVDFVGTRLHAGIRSLQYKNRTIIIGVDNRAKEKEKDFNVKVIDRKDIKSSLNDEINAHWSTEIKIPVKAINEWKEQF